MYALTKVYAKAVQAVNAIRMTARPKGWQVLEVEEAAKFVVAKDGGFVVDNDALNARMGFAAITDGKTLEAVSDALAEKRKQQELDAQAVAKFTGKKLQAASKMEQSKKENLAPKAKKAEKAPVARSEIKNGARRPAKAGKTLLVWETTEAMQKASPDGKCPTLKEVYAELCKADPGFNKTTCSIQFYACRTYNGWDK